MSTQKIMNPVSFLFYAIGIVLSMVAIVIGAAGVVATLSVLALGAENVFGANGEGTPLILVPMLLGAATMIYFMILAGFSKGIFKYTQKLHDMINDYI